MLDTIDKILRYTSEYKSAEELYQNDRDSDAAMMNFIVLGEESGKLTDELKNINPQVNWSKVYGLRNIIAHHYFRINVDIVWQIIVNDLPKLKTDLKALIS
ncbi:MAG: DUF86 domain-containing protein [Prolixibacteraceae bacterium]|nr:DUF86 domain-containing protein [Prolixibacteraceae bacterium]